MLIYGHHGTSVCVWFILSVLTEYTHEKYESILLIIYNFSQYFYRNIFLLYIHNILRKISKNYIFKMLREWNAMARYFSLGNRRVNIWKKLKLCWLINCLYFVLHHFSLRKLSEGKCWINFVNRNNKRETDFMHHYDENGQPWAVL